MRFRISPLPKALSENPFELSKTGFPCRVSLDKARIGEERIFVNQEHHPANTPFQATHAVYIGRTRRGALEIGIVPAALCGGTISPRATDKTPKKRTVAFIHLHYHLHLAKPGCYAARADRA